MCAAIDGQRSRLTARRISPIANGIGEPLVAISGCIWYNIPKESEVFPMIKILFVCHGNICRSPIAEFVFKDITKGFDLIIESKAVSREELGNPIFPPAASILTKKGIPFGNHVSRQITREDYDEFDYIIVMENYNIPRLMRIIGEDDEGKVCRLLDFTDNPKDIEDPWFSGNFEKVYDEIYKGCLALFDRLKERKEI